MTEVVRVEIVDVPHLLDSRIDKDELKTKIVSRALYVYDEKNSYIITEK